MTTDPIRLPDDPDARDALTRYLKATALYATRRELLRRVQKGLDDAHDEMTAAHQACMDLGLIPKAGRGVRGEIRGRILNALPGTLQEITDHTGLPKGRVAPALTRLHQEGAVARTGTPGKYVWRHPQPAAAT